MKKQTYNDDHLVAAAERASGSHTSALDDQTLDQALSENRSLVDALLDAAEEHALALAKRAKAAAVAVRNALFTAVGMTTITLGGTAGAIVATTYNFDPKASRPSSILVDQPKSTATLPNKPTLK